MTRERILFLGMDSIFSVAVLESILEHGLDVTAVFKPIGSLESRRLDHLNRSTYFGQLATRAVRRYQTAPQEETDPFEVAGKRGIPCYLVGDASGKKSVARIKKIAPDAICIAFFNQLLRKKVIEIPRFGCINTHPSLLPAYRGPSPLFWMFKNGERKAGVTVHLVDRGEDSGAILQQEATPIPGGVTGPELLAKLARSAARLVPRALDDLLAQRTRPIPQESARASRHARPSPADLEVRFDGEAEAVFNCVRGLSRWAPLWALIGGEHFRIVDAVGYDANARLGADFVLTGDQAAVQCSHGVVVLRARRTPLDS